jgi:eukaryotic-like serine/threonine-protein kinase
MPLPSGARIGPYEIVGLLGAGGMGEVYRATDLHLGRAAAIKVLPETFALDAERIARLEREARTLASLNHPNIAQVFGFEKGDAGVALAMELVEGPTLADRIDRGPIPIDEAITIARQVAEALEAAHDQGIVHRDLKPANVTVRNDGTVKVLDFGLAKAIEAGAGSRESGVGNTLAEPTVTTPAMTATGLIMGTAAYMSPEQARGRAVDRRADIWAFGCVLYEMLTGRRAFPGDDISDVLVAVLRDEPDLSALPSDTPRHIRKLLRRCLQKDPRNRLPHIGAARLELSDPLDSAEAPITPRGSRSRVGERALWAAVVAGLAGLLALAVQPSRDGTMPARAVVFDIPPPSGARFPGGNGVPRFALSPDGSRLAYQARVGNSTAWFVRRLDAVTSQQVPGTEAGSDVAAQGLFWSPDNQSLAFFDEPGRKLKKVDLGTSTVSVLCDVTGNQHGGSWNADGVIIFSSAASGGVWKVPAPGGKAIPLTTLDEARGETPPVPSVLAGQSQVRLSRSGPGSRSIRWVARRSCASQAVRFDQCGRRGAAGRAPCPSWRFTGHAAVRLFDPEAHRRVQTGRKQCSPDGRRACCCLSLRRGRRLCTCRDRHFDGRFGTLGRPKRPPARSSPDSGRPRLGPAVTGRTVRRIFRWRPRRRFGNLALRSGPPDPDPPFGDKRRPARGGVLA